MIPRWPAAAGLLMATFANVHAQRTDEAAPATELAPVVVTATRVERALLDVPASVDVIGRETLRDAQPRVNLSETLSRVPGIVVLDRQNYAQDLQISIRGFGSRATFGVRGVRLYVDGVPATSPDGQGQVSHFPLGAAERIEVLRGPFSALYGNSSGGVIALSSELRPQNLAFTPNGFVDSSGAWRAGVNAVGGSDSYAFAVDASRFRTPGEREHSAASRNTVNLRFGVRDSPLGHARVSLNALDMPNTQDPLGLTRAQFDADPTQVAANALQFNTRKNTRQVTLGANTEAALGQGRSLSASAWLGTRSITQFLSIPVAVQANPLQPGGVVDFDRVFGGADLRATWDIDAMTASIGLSAERLDEDRRGYENFIGSTLGVLGRLRRDENNVLTAIDPYAQLEWRVADRWRLHAGMRYSQVRFESRDHYVVGTNGDDSGARSFSALNPSVGIVYRPNAALAWYAAYGRGFETPTLNELAYRPDGSAGFNDGLSAARSHNFEVGVKYLAGRALRATLALFASETRDELTVRTSSGGRSSFANVARTRRDGVEASIDWRPTAAWSVYVSAAYLDARFDTSFLACGAAPCTAPSVPVPAGSKLPGVPARTLYAELKYRAGWADLGAEWRAQSSLWVNDANTDRAPGYGVLNLVAARSVKLAGHKARLYVRLNNALDKTHAGSVIVNEGNSRFFEPAPGVSGLIGIDLTL